ncbi:MAG: DegT/DnrJ/EryC1/StrS aminotransferase family protein [Bryobacterales bacterium]
MSTSPDFIPFNEPSIGEEEIQEVVETLRSGWLTMGPRTQRFEREFAAAVGAREAVALSSATAGLQLALAALGIGPGDEVITTPLTFCATVEVILHMGATPVLADVADDGNIDPEEIRRRIGPRTKAVMPVHLGGLPCRMAEIWALAREHGLAVVEDAAHTPGAVYRGAPIGGPCPPHGASDAVVFSFYANKNMTTGEGGMATTQRQDLADRMRLLRLHGINKDGWKRYHKSGTWAYEVSELGYKANMSDIQAAMGIHQLAKVPRFTAERERLATLFDEAFAEVEEIVRPRRQADSQHAWHLYAIRVRPEKLAISRSEFIEQLKERGVGTSVHFIPVPLHPFFANHAADPRNRCPRALALYERLISLPLYPGLGEERAGRVVDAVRDVARRNRVKVFAAAV